ncbi:MAG: DUF434 domain-containing protein, partial [Candidatus Desulfofervidaceae bacterium]|nr:DUF434 domain-containing protein [Candidatus Desulfofervidaceae bacterium]
MKIFNIPRKAIEDLRYFLSQGYKPTQALTWVGNRYQLSSKQRQLLQRGVCSLAKAKSRLQKKQGLWRVQKACLGIDGHNVIITVESALKNKPLLLADDGFIRDISGVSSSYRPTSISLKALNMILKILSFYQPKQVDWFFDAPISYSGELAATIRKQLKAFQLKGNAHAVKVPEHFLPTYPLVATSDSVLIDTCA